MKMFFENSVKHAIFQLARFRMWCSASVSTRWSNILWSWPWLRNKNSTWCFPGVQDQLTGTISHPIQPYISLRQGQTPMPFYRNIQIVRLFNIVEVQCLVLCCPHHSLFKNFLSKVSVPQAISEKQLSKTSLTLIIALCLVFRGWLEQTIQPCSKWCCCVN